MNKEEIIRMAHEANRYANNQTDAEGYEWHLIRDERFAALVAAAEREACAKVCDEVGGRDTDTHAWDAAAAIRARGEK